jgi:ATP-dependent RNA helicase RhlE
VLYSSQSTARSDPSRILAVQADLIVPRPVAAHIWSDRHQWPGPAVRTTTAARPQEVHVQFSDLNLAEPILRAVITEGYTTATPVQAAAIPPALAGRDVLASAQTGTGKTAAFALPILHRLSATAGGKKARCLILCPTRELAAQIRDAFHAYGRHLNVRMTLIFGGVNQNPQVNDLRRGVDVIVATPGRLMDLMQQGHVDLSAVETFVLDECDRMLDMGFLPDIKRIGAKVPPGRQTMLFSATLPTEIKRLASAMLRDPAVIDIAPVKQTDALIDQCVYFVDKAAKPALLARLVNELAMFRTIAFTRTKHGADRLTQHLNRAGIKAEAIHGNKSQNARTRALANFKSGKVPVLVATDVAARGIDVDSITHVVNYDLTHEPETYMHRIGRTGRAGANGMAIAFCNREEMPFLKDIERMLRKPIPVKEKLWGAPPTAAEVAAAAHDDRDERPAEGHREGFPRPQGQRQGPASARPRTSHPVAGHAKPARAGGQPGRGAGRPGGGARPQRAGNGGGSRRPTGR